MASPPDLATALQLSSTLSLPCLRPLPPRPAGRRGSATHSVFSFFSTEHLLQSRSFPLPIHLMASRPGHGPPNASGNPPSSYGQRPGGYPPEQGPYRGPASANSSQVPLATYDQSPSYDSHCSYSTSLALPRSSPQPSFYSPEPRILRPPLQSPVFRLRRLPPERCQHEPTRSLL